MFLKYFNCGLAHSKCSVNVCYYQYVQCILLIELICKAHFSNLQSQQEKRDIADS